MSFFKNINATPRIGSVIVNPNGFSIYTDSGWQEYTENDILDIIDNARVVERVDGSCVDIDDIFGEHISDERVLYELILRSVCNLPLSQIAYMSEDGQIYIHTLQLSVELIILGQREIHIRGWFSSCNVIRDIFEKYPNNIEFYMKQVVKYLQKLKSEGLTYKYIDESYMHSVTASYSV